MEVHFRFTDVRDNIARLRDKILLVVFFSFLCVVLFSSCNMTPARADVLSIARLEIGHGEIFGNNRGPYVRQYLNGSENLPWCAGFVSYCIKRSGGNSPYTLRARDFLILGKKVHTPAPGDIVVFSRGAAGHVGIVERVFGSCIVTIEGNLGEFPSKVKRVTYKNKPKNLLGYVRLARAK